MSAPKLYLAGKISKNDWRHDLIPELRITVWLDAPLDCGSYLYVGPFFVGCDHGCFHVPTGHGTINNGPKACGDDHSKSTHKEVRHRCLKAVDECDVFLAYIDSPECYGTIAETEHAISKNKLVVMAFAPGMASSAKDEFWFVSDEAHRRIYDVAESDLPELLYDLVRRPWW